MQLSGSQQELAVSVSKKDGQLSDPDFHVPEQQISTSSSGGKISEVAQQLQEEAMRRLQSLQEQLVGGEKRNDQNLKEKRKARKQYAQSKREKLMKAVENMEDDGIMVKVYDNLQDEVKVKNRKVYRHYVSVSFCIILYHFISSCMLIGCVKVLNITVIHVHLGNARLK